MSLPLIKEQKDQLRELVQNAREYINGISADTTDLRVYVVGGSIRDALIGRESNDWDFVVEEESVESMLERGFQDINASSFGVLHDENHEEWALTRTDTKIGDGYKGIKPVVDGVSLNEDLNRRDLTVNSIALKVFGSSPVGISNEATYEMVVDDKHATLIDPNGGVKDIRNATLKHIGEKYSEDPIRVLRTARYAARYEYVPPQKKGEEDNKPVQFTIDPETKNLMTHVSPELNRMGRDRLGEEIIKAMKQAVDPVRFWDVLKEVGALAVIAPELDRASIVPAGPTKYHREGDTYTHTMMVLDEMHKICCERDITGTDRVRRYLMAISHDIGKVPIADDQGGLWSDDPPTRFGGHAEKGVDVVDHLSIKMGLHGQYKEVMSEAAELHMDIHNLIDWNLDQLIDFVMSHTPNENAKSPYYATITELLDLAQADHQGRYQTHPDKIQNNETNLKNESDYQTIGDGPDGVVKPVFDREMFDAYVHSVQKVVDEIDGYEVLRDGLCRTHHDSDIDNGDIARVLNQCDDCRSPGEWVGDELHRRQKVQFQLQFQA